MNNELFELCERLLTAILNGAYQGILLTLLVWAALRFAIRSNAATRHAIWFCTLLLMTLLVGVHIFSEFRGKTFSAEGAAAASDSSGAQTFPEVTIFQPSMTIPAGDSFLIASETQDAETIVEMPAEESVVGSDSLGMSSPDWSAVSTSETSKLPAPGLLQNLRQVAARFFVPVFWTVKLNRGIGSFATVSALACFCGLAVFRVFCLIARLREIRVLKRQSLPPDTQSHEIFQQVRAISRVKRPVTLRVSPTIVSPVMLGFRHPVILVSAQDKPEELKEVLRHELAHVARRDDWVNLFQQLIQAVLFYHPAVWWVSRQLSLEREIACDDHVLQQGSSAKSYALLLTNLAGRIQSTGSLEQLAPGVSTKRSQLKQRIAMLLDTTRNRSPRLAAARLGFMVSGAAILTVAAICSGPRIVLGQNAPPPAQATTLVSVTPSLPPSESTLPVAALVSVAPDAENPPGVDAGPKYKPGKAQSGDNTPAPPATPIAPLPPKMAIAAAPAHAPHPPHAVTVSSGDSLEDRLDRLEKAVQALLDSKGGKPGASYYSPKPESFNYSLNWDRKELEHNKELAKSLAEMEKNKSRAELNKQWNLADPKWKMEFKDSITRETARAGEEVRRAERDAQKAMAEQKRSTRTQIRLGTRMQLDALRKQLDALEHQKDSLHREIERLEKEQGRGKGDSDDEDSSEQDSSADVQ